MKANLQQSGKPPLKQQNGANLQIPSKGVKNNQIDVAFVGARKNSKQQSPGLAKDTDNIFQSANDTVRGDAEDVVKKNRTVDVSLGTHKNGKN